MKNNYVTNTLSSILYKIGYSIGCHPQKYFAVMFLITVLFGFGIHKLSLLKDTEYLFTPINSRSKMEREMIETMFPEKVSTGNNIFSRTRLGKFGFISVLPKNNASMLDTSALNDVLKLDSIVRNISFYWNNKFVGYNDLFPRTFDKYTRNMILFFKRNAEKIKNGTYSIKFPIDKRNYVTYGLNAGGVYLNESGYLKNFKAFRLLYFLDNFSEENNEINSIWEENFMKVLSKVRMPNIKFYLWTSHAFEYEANMNTELSIPLAIKLIPLKLLFIIISCISLDVITSKPFVGLAGYLSPIFATASAFGLLLWCNVEYIDINICVIFLVMGIGVDDSFVLLAAWRRTNRIDSVEKRMAETYSDAAVSITITSLTNFLSFCIGLTTPYRIIQIFSLYSMLSILFDYIYQIFFFGGLIALDGYREKYNLHCFTLSTVKMKSSGNENSEESKFGKIERNVVMSFFGNVLGTFLGKRIIKAFAIFIFIVYITCALYFMRRIKENMNWLNIYPKSSKSFKYISVQNKYFNEYPHIIQVIFNETLDYSDPKVQFEIEKILSDFESSPFVSNSSCTICWFRSYREFVNHSSSNYLFDNYNLTTSEDYLDGLKNIFLKIKLMNSFKNDIVFNNEGDQIIASRCYLVSHKVYNSTAEKFLLENLRRISDNAKYSVYVHSLLFPYFEQYLNMPNFYIKNIGFAILIVTIVFYIFIPDLFFTCLAALTVISIQVTTIGFMAFWDVSLDVISIIILIMSSGFSIDYSAHVMHSYKISKEKEPNDKIKNTLYNVGYAIIQGYITTIIGVLVLHFGPSYTFVVFFKIVVLVLLFAVYHGLVLIPIILSIVDSIHFPWKNKIQINPVENHL